jgi:hypothetical protein
MKRLSLTMMALLLCTAIFAQTDVSSPTYTASVLKLNKVAVEPIAAKTLTPPAAASYRSPKQKAGIALLVIGPVDMMVGFGLIGWAAATPRAYYTDAPVDNRRIALGTALGAFHVITGAALTAGGAVLLHKGRKESGNVYLRMPEPDMHLGKATNAGGIKTGLVF